MAKKNGNQTVVVEEMDLTKVNFEEATLETLLKIQAQIAAKTEGMKKEQTSKFNTVFSQAIEAFSSGGVTLTPIQVEAIKFVSSPENQGKEKIQGYIEVEGAKKLVMVRAKGMRAKKAK